MLCKNQHSPTKNKKPPVSSGFRLPLHFTTSSIPPNPHLNHKLPQQNKEKKKKRKHDNPQILPPPLLPLSPPNPQRKGKRLSSFQLLHRLSRFQRPTHQSTLVSRCPSRFTDSRSDFSRTHHVSRSRRKKRRLKKVHYTTTSSSFYRSRSEDGVRIFLLFPLFSSVISFLFSHHFFILLSWGNKTDGKIPTTCSVLNGTFTMYRFWCDMNWWQWQWRDILQQQNKSRKWEDWSKGRFWMRDDYKNWSMDDDDDPFIYQNNRGKRRDKGWKKALALCVLFTYSIKKN